MIKKTGTELNSIDLTALWGGASIEMATLLLKSQPRVFWAKFGHQTLTGITSEWGRLLYSACTNPALARLVIAKCRSYSSYENVWKKQGAVILKGIASNKTWRESALNLRCKEVLPHMEKNSASDFGDVASALAWNPKGLEALETLMSFVPCREHNEEQKKQWSYGRCGFDSSGLGSTEERQIAEAFIEAQCGMGVAPIKKEKMSLPYNFMWTLCVRARAEAASGHEERSQRYWKLVEQWIDAGATPNDSALALCLTQKNTILALERRISLSGGPSFYHREITLTEAFLKAPAALAADIEHIDELIQVKRGFCCSDEDSNTPPAVYFAVLAKSFDAIQFLKKPDEKKKYDISVRSLTKLKENKNPDLEDCFGGRSVKRTVLQLAEELGAPEDCLIHLKPVKSEQTAEQTAGGKCKKRKL